LNRTLRCLKVPLYFFKTWRISIQFAYFFNLHVVALNFCETLVFLYKFEIYCECKLFWIVLFSVFCAHIPLCKMRIFLVRVFRSDFWVTILFNFERLMHHCYQSNRKSNVTGVLEKDESNKWGTFHSINLFWIWSSMRLIHIRRNPGVSN